MDQDNATESYNPNTFKYGALENIVVPQGNRFPVIEKCEECSSDNSSCSTTQHYNKAANNCDTGLNKLTPELSPKDQQRDRFPFTEAIGKLATAINNGSIRRESVIKRNTSISVTPKKDNPGALDTYPGCTNTYNTTTSLLGNRKGTCDYEVNFPDHQNSDCKGLKVTLKIENKKFEPNVNHPMNEIHVYVPPDARYDRDFPEPLVISSSSNRKRDGSSASLSKEHRQMQQRLNELLKSIDSVILQKTGRHKEQPTQAWDKDDDIKYYDDRMLKKSLDTLNNYYREASKIYAKYLDAKITKIELSRQVKRLKNKFSGMKSRAKKKKESMGEKMEFYSLLKEASDLQAVSKELEDFQKLMVSHILNVKGREDDALVCLLKNSTISQFDTSKIGRWIEDDCSEMHLYKKRKCIDDN